MITVIGTSIVCPKYKRVSFPASVTSENGLLLISTTQSAAVIVFVSPLTVATALKPVKSTSSYVLPAQYVVFLGAVISVIATDVLSDVYDNLTLLNVTLAFLAANNPTYIVSSVIKSAAEHSAATSPSK